MKQTAVEWLMQEIDNKDMGEIPVWIYDFCKKALEIEKEQICNAWENGYDELDRTGRTSLNYYHETFKLEQHFTCEQFISDNKTSSTTKCICGKEKFEHKNL
jgi:hypothetical protein